MKEAAVAALFAFPLFALTACDSGPSPGTPEAMQQAGWVRLEPHLTPPGKVLVEFPVEFLDADHLEANGWRISDPTITWDDIRDGGARLKPVVIIRGPHSENDGPDPNPRPYRDPCGRKR